MPKPATGDAARTRKIAARNAAARSGPPPAKGKSEKDKDRDPHRGASKRKRKRGSAAALAVSDGPRTPIHVATVLPKLAHELRTPLSAIAAAAEIMRDERLGPLSSARYGGYAADIYATAQHALTVIDRTLRAAAEPTNAATAPLEAVDVNAVAEAMVSLMSPLAGRADIKLAKSLSPLIRDAVADAVGLRQALLNLLTNALKFTPPGGRVRVSTRPAADGNVEIEVRDNGAGMTQTELAQALAPSARKPARRKGGGLGLGLPTVRTVCEIMGASMSIESKPGKGTTVSIVLPVVPQRARRGT